MAIDKDHHLIKRENIWYFRKEVKGKLIKRALSKSITEARGMRDQILREIQLYGNPQTVKSEDQSGRLFGEVVQDWVKIISSEIRKCTKPRKATSGISA